MKLLLMTLIGIFTIQVHAFDAEKYFKQNCKSCHTIGGGDTVGPDLAGLHERRKIEWTVKFINYPEGMINGDPEEAGYEKADVLAKKVYEKYKPTVMSEFSVDKAKVQAIFDYIKGTGLKPSGKILTVK